MALDAQAVYTAARGFIFTAPVDTAAPTAAAVAAFDPNTPTVTTYETVGHTARDELPVFGYEGGETETRGTWQAEVIRTVQTEVPSDYVTFNVHQFDESNLEFYYGSANVNTTEEGVYSVNSSGVNAIQRALLIIIVDGEFRLGFHASKVDIRREDSIELAVDEFAYMPLRATLLKSDTAGKPLFSWINVNTPSIPAA
jgi:hypothetical protein